MSAYVHLLRQPKPEFMPFYAGRGVLLCFPKPDGTIVRYDPRTGTEFAASLGLDDLSARPCMSTEAAIEQARRILTTLPTNSADLNALKFEPILSAPAHYTAVPRGEPYDIPAGQLACVLCVQYDHYFLDLAFVQPPNKLTNFSNREVHGLGLHSGDVHVNAGEGEHQCARNLQRVLLTLQPGAWAILFLNSYMDGPPLPDYDDPIYVFMNPDETGQRYVLVPPPLRSTTRSAFTAVVQRSADGKSHRVWHLTTTHFEDDGGSKNGIIPEVLKQRLERFSP